MELPLVSIVVRSFNEAWALHGTLEALRTQTYSKRELIVIDSGSTDGSVDLIKQANPDRFHQIEPHEYNPARVMNWAMGAARAEYGLFINADATPLSRDWAEPLVSALLDPQTAAVFGRQIPRPDCRAVYAHDYERCFGPSRESGRWPHFFSMANSGIRKDIWSQRGFNERMRYSEDDEYTRWCRARGYKIVYVPEAVAMHSHNYSPAQAWKRCYGEGEALAAVWEGPPSAAWNWPRSVLLGWANDARRDLLFCWRQRQLREWPHSVRIRWVQRRARFRGFQDGWTSRQTEVTTGSAR